MAKTTIRGHDKFDKVMHEFAVGMLYSSDGTKVTDQKQALAIAYSEQAAKDKRRKKKKRRRS